MPEALLLAQVSCSYKAGPCYPVCVVLCCAVLLCVLSGHMVALWSHRFAWKNWIASSS
jgi:hypothetical protein